jgi:hypothetical protein
MSFDLEKILESKRALGRQLAARSVAERLRMLDTLTGLIPPRAIRDAIHIGVSAVHQVDFLLTWNCRHINNANIQQRLRRACRAAGFELPVICSPNGLLGSSPKL